MLKMTVAILSVIKYITKKPQIHNTGTELVLKNIFIEKINQSHNYSEEMWEKIINFGLYSNYK